MTDDLRTHVAALALFEGVATDGLEPFLSTIEAVAYSVGDVVVRHGDPADHFGLVLTGEAEVTDGPTGRHIGRAGPGSVIGELGLLRGETRNATVTATTPMKMVLGGHDAFSALLAIENARIRLARQASQHVAGSVPSVKASLSDGTTVLIRPILPDYADGFREALDRLSPVSRRLRFFTSGPLPPSLIRYLTDLDYRNHFAWVVVPTGAGPRDGIGSGRFVRLADRPDTAEIALTVADEYQRRGLGRLLLGAIAIAADEADVAMFEGEVLRDNGASLGLFSAVGARRVGGDRTAMRMEVSPERLIAEIDAGVAARLRAVATEVLRFTRIAIAPPE